MKEMKLQKKHQMKDMLQEMIPLQRSTEAQAMNTKKVSKQNNSEDDNKNYHEKRNKKMKSWIFYTQTKEQTYT